MVDIGTAVDLDWHQQELAELQRRKERIARMEQALADGDTREFLRICEEIDSNEDEEG